MSGILNKLIIGTRIKICTPGMVEIPYFEKIQSFVNYLFIIMTNLYAWYFWIIFTYKFPSVFMTEIWWYVYWHGLMMALLNYQIKICRLLQILDNNSLNHLTNLWINNNGKNPCILDWENILILKSWLVLIILLVLSQGFQQEYALCNALFFTILYQIISESYHFINYAIDKW